MSPSADRWIRWTTTGCVAMLALIAATVSYLHMHMLVESHGQPGWVAALTPFSVDGMIVAASTTLLADSRAGGRGGVLPWALLVVGSAASLAANVAVAEPTAAGRVIAAWPSFALIAAYELLMRQVRRSAVSGAGARERSPGAQPGRRLADSGSVRGAALALAGPDGASAGQCGAVAAGRDLQRQAWQWAQDNRTRDGSLPIGRQIADQYGRHERWGRLVKRSGLAGEFARGDEPGLHLVKQQATAATNQ
ncbi:MAG: DUF2637 domain-containing protein [Streptosporangiaceae bacterium]